MTSPQLLRLHLRDFRCFERFEWRPPAPRVIVVGGNGAGKTTLLEALYLAATTRSFRTARIAQCARRDAPGFAVRAEVGERPTRELALSWSAGERSRTLDGRAATLAEHLAVLPVLAWTRADNELVAGAPELRRRFVDRGLVHVRPPLLGDLARYRQALAEKRALLARRERGGLESWNRLLARHGAALAAARATLAEEVGSELGELVRGTEAALPAVALRYRPAVAAALEGEEALARALEAARGEELGRGVPLVGPHRDDFELSWKGAVARGAVSAGEAKTLGILLLAALARRLAAAGREPALLVDDVEAELDASRVGAVTGLLGGFSQVLLTSSREEAFRGLDGFARVALPGPGTARAGGP